MSTIENTEIVNTDNLSTKYGLGAGIIMALILLLFQISGNDYSPFMKLSKYIVLILAIVVSLNLYKKNSDVAIFKKGISFGFKLSLIAGLVLVISNVVLYLINPELSFSKYSIEPSSLRQVAMVSGVLFFESLVFGGLITFAVLQYLKD